MANPPANHGDIPHVCTLTTRSKAHACVNAALSSKFHQSVDDNTELKTQNGLGLDDEELENDVLHVIEPGRVSSRLLVNAANANVLIECFLYSYRFSADTFAR